MLPPTQWVAPRLPVDWNLLSPVLSFTCLFVFAVLFISGFCWLISLLNVAINRTPNEPRPSVRALEASRRAAERRPRQWGNEYFRSQNIPRSRNANQNTRTRPSSL